MDIKLLVVGSLLTNCYLVVSKEELLIIDPGGEGKKILQEAEKTKARIRYIVNTHGHPDHVFANEEIRKETGAKILIHEAEKNFISFRADSFLKDEDEIKIGDSTLKVLHTPGHTKGGICLLGKDLVFTGDTLFKDGYGRTDLPGGSEKELEKSLEKLKKTLKPGMTVYPGHGEIFKV
ncbi:MAG TPA: MBL fold metallo-hydrolase [Candidatus Humimicrobiaceae bacterium]|nr:MBL fold metallo-hydrolase [Candidatus Humimicrobiaceae bacterium]